MRNSKGCVCAVEPTVPLQAVSVAGSREIIKDIPRVSQASLFVLCQASLQRLSLSISTPPPLFRFPEESFPHPFPHRPKKKINSRNAPRQIHSHRAGRHVRGCSTITVLGGVGHRSCLQQSQQHACRRYSKQSLPVVDPDFLLSILPSHLVGARPVCGENLFALIFSDGQDFYFTGPTFRHIIARKDTASNQD